MTGQVPTQFGLTQQFVAQILPVRRPSVTVAAGMLQKAGLIRYGQAAPRSKLLRVLRGRKREFERPATGLTSPSVGRALAEAGELLVKPIGHIDVHEARARCESGAGRDLNASIRAFKGGVLDTDPSAVRAPPERL
jgi:hypothetical protein